MKELLKGIRAIFGALKVRTFGLQGCNYILAANPTRKGNWMSIKADGSVDVLFTTLTTTNGDNLDGWVLKAGDVIYGHFTNIDISTGNVAAYFHN